MATLWPEIQRATLDIIGRAYARVHPAKDVADELARRLTTARDVES